MSLLFLPISGRPKPLDLTFPDYEVGCQVAARPEQERTNSKVMAMKSHTDNHAGFLLLSIPCCKQDTFSIFRTGRRV